MGMTILSKIFWTALVCMVLAWGSIKITDDGGPVWFKALEVLVVYISLATCIVAIFIQIWR